MLGMPMNPAKYIERRSSHRAVGFAKRYVEGRVVLYIHVWLRFPEGEAVQWCAVLESAERKHVMCNDIELRDECTELCLPTDIEFGADRQSE